MIPFHRFADIFPLIDGPEFDALVENIRLNGVHEPIFIYEDAILDGRNRYRALVRLQDARVPLGSGWGVWAGAPMPDDLLEIAAIQHPFRRFITGEQGDPLDFVEAKNIHRRNLSPSQRAACAADLEELRQGRPPKARFDDKDANLHLLPAEQSETPRAPETRAELAARYDVSERSIADAAKVRDQGAPELKAALKQGDVVADVAATIAESLPAERQTEVLANLPRDDAGKLTTEAKKEVRALAKELRAEQQAEKKQRRQEREREQGAAQLALPTRTYGVVVADPEHDFEPFNRDTGMDRHAGNHYATSALETIMARRPDLDRISAADCVLGLWVTDLANGLRILEAWGFTYKSYFVWVKDIVDYEFADATRTALKLPAGRFLHVVGPPGTGYWNRDRDELMLIGVRGAPACPAMGTQGESVWFAARPHVEGTERDKHSAKPDICFDWFDRHFPSFRKIELNARIERDGWDRWGLEAPTEQGTSGEVAADTATIDGEDFDPETGELPPIWSDEEDHAADAAAEAGNEAMEAAGEPT